jgi:hypothetical protein
MFHTSVFRRTLATMLALVITACGPTHKTTHISSTPKSSLRSVAYESVTTTGVNVINENMDKTATAGAFFGVIGAVVSASHTQMEDDRSSAELGKTLGTFEIRPLLDERINVTMLQNGTEVLPKTAAVSDARLTLTVVSWGVRRMTRENTLLSPYIALDIRMTDAKGAVLWEKREVTQGQHQATLEEYKAKPDMLRKELEKTIRLAAETVAYQIIYR